MVKVPSWFKYIAIIQELSFFVFQVGVIAAVVLLLVDQYQPGFVSQFFNQQFFIWWSLYSGLLYFVLSRWYAGDSKAPRHSWTATFFRGLILASLVIVLVRYELDDVFQNAVGIAVLCGIIIFVMAITYFRADGSSF